MEKQKVALIVLGHSNIFFDVKKVKNWKSTLFEVTNIQTIENLPASEVNDCYLDQKFETDQLSKLIKCPTETNFAIGIMAYRFVDNFYMHRLGHNRVIVSLYGITDLLTREGISIENFILKQIYEVVALKCLFGDISVDEVDSLVHLDTRGCLFDLNGDKQHIVYNTEKPKLCDSCKSEFKKRQIEENIISKLEHELNRINKPIIQRLEIFIQRYPLVSMLITGLMAILLNVLASALWEVIKLLSKKSA